MAKAASEEEAQALIAPLQGEISARLAGHIYGVDRVAIETVIHRQLQARGETIGVAESCTGGRIAAALTAVPGSSKSFLGGIVAYDNSVKIAQLGVDEATLASHGAVSEQTAREMARGARERLRTTHAIATTGIAGPDGGTSEKPVGLVWFALDIGGDVKSYQFNFRGDRDAIQRRATMMALGLIWRALESRT